MFLVSFGQCAHSLWTSKSSDLVQQRIVGSATIAMFIFATLDVSLGLRHLLVAFVYYKGPGGAEEQYTNISYWVNAMAGLDYTCQSIIGDFVLVRRNISFHVPRRFDLTNS